MATSEPAIVNVEKLPLFAVPEPIGEGVAKVYPLRAEALAEVPLNAVELIVVFTELLPTVITLVLTATPLTEPT